jgi:3-hydroxy-3-methylglutaryl CoA synthase/uncharacterized OB-fold protein
VAGIVGWGAHIPVHRMDRAMLGRAWDTPALPGERAVAAGDEDSLTMAVEASLAAVGADASEIDAVYYASTTPPYHENHAAATIAGVLDRREASTADFTGTTRAGTQALRAAVDAVHAGTARRVLVAAADMRPAEPATAMEQLFGDGAGALVVAKQAPVEVIGRAAVNEGVVGPWRRAGKDPFVRNFDAKLETEYGYVRPVAAAAAEALARAGVDADKTRFVAGLPDPRTFSAAARKIGVADAKDPLAMTLGNLGAAHPLVSLADALDRASAGDVILLAAHGEGADAMVLRVGDVSRPSVTVAGLIAAKRMLPSYESYLRFRRLLPWDDPVVRSSTIAYWRDRRQALPFEGVRCRACGQVQFPNNRACVECAVLDQMDPVKLARSGTVFTFTLDHLAGGEYLETPVPRLVVDLDGGGRVFFEMTDGDPHDVAIGMRVELTFRRLHDGAGFANYYWKARPPRLGARG